jgi:hypothetical protein
VLQLAVAPDECPSQAAHAARAHQREGAHEPAAPDRLRLPLRLDCRLLLELEGAAGRRRRARADENLAWFGRLLQPRRHVDGVAAHERARFARPRGDDVAAVDADPQLEPLVELAHAVSHRQGGVERPLGVVLERDRSAECGHDGVAGELLDRAAGALHLLRHRVVEAFEQRARPLRILRVAELCRTDEVGEEHRRELPLHCPILYQPERAVTSFTCTAALSPRSVIQTR